MSSPASANALGDQESIHVRVGPAGWRYDDWCGIVYPKDEHIDELEYLSHFFDTIEINSSFYRPIARTIAKGWAKRVAHNPRFRFTAKLYQVFTHQRGKATAEDEKSVRDGLDALSEAGVFGALLLQFPWSFKNTAETRRYLAGLLEQFRDYPLVLEVRHSSWNRPAVYESLERRAAGLCNIDQPLFHNSIPPSARVTSKIGYVRLHGRNYENWFAENKDAGARYDYLYSPEELDPWLENIRQLLTHTSQVYVIANNHFQGKAVVNSLQIRSMLEHRQVRSPGSLAQHYPDFEAYAVAEEES